MRPQENHDVEGSSKIRTRFGSVAREIKAKKPRLDVEESEQKCTRSGSVAQGIKAKDPCSRKPRDDNKEEINVLKVRFQMQIAGQRGPLTGKVHLCIMVIILVIFCFLEPIAGQPAQGAHANCPYTRHQGVLDSLPVVTYPTDARVRSRNTECSICLGQFAEGDNVSVLPVSWDNQKIPPPRCVWISCYGIPLNAWCSSTFIEIGKFWGDVIKLDELTEKSIAFDKGRMLIIMDYLDCINELVHIKINGVIFPVKVIEDPMA
ncbi:hypothetical protein RHSIM_Rhsim02G0177400 [Rhododendron simsii]|uniref:DUF4283 domain-containing protein n=1 Tax=Rhododendron simsii TaxID=118357 RepID=A0A834HFT1_RHOSS|nr:hypothetical protein RHSIM_Rhsim02G0177400 [Rhododendron simsii]